MKSFLINCTVLFYMSCCFGQQPDTLVIENVNLIPMTQEVVLENRRVTIVQGKILKIEKASDKDSNLSGTVIDATGKYLIPGLSEMHYHYRNEERDIATEFKLLIANGVTTARNMAAYRWQKTDQVEVRNKVASGELLGPNYYTAGPYLKFDDLSTSEKISEVVAQHKEKGYDFLKIADNLPQELYIQLLEKANNAGIEVIGHAQRKLPLEFSLRMKSIEHVEEFVYINNGDEHHSYLNNNKADLDSIASQVRLSGAYVAPTLIVFDYITECVNDNQFQIHKQSPLAGYLGQEERSRWLSEENPYREIKDKEFDGVPVPELFRNYLRWMKSFTRILSDHGVPLLTGSDTFGLVIPGFSIHDEFIIWQEAGIRPFDILRASTVNAARYLNTISSEGTISEGKNANLVLLSDNPLMDIGNTKKISAVFLKGQYFDRSDLDHLLDEVKSE